MQSRTAEECNHQQIKVRLVYDVGVFTGAKLGRQCMEGSETDQGGRHCKGWHREDCEERRQHHASGLDDNAVPGDEPHLGT